MAQDLAHIIQYLETARKRVASEQESPIHLREPIHGMQLKAVHMIIADSAKTPCPNPTLPGSS